MTKELEQQKIQQARLAIEDLLENGIYDYYHGTFDGKMTKTSNYGWTKYELKELLENLTGHNTL